MGNEDYIYNLILNWVTVAILGMFHPTRTLYVCVLNYFFYY